MKKLSFFFILFSLIVLVGCEKDNETTKDSPSPQNEEKITKYCGEWKGENISFKVISDGEYSIRGVTIKHRNETRTFIENLPINGSVVDYTNSNGLTLKGKFNNNINFTGEYTFDGESNECSLDLVYSFDISFENCSSIGAKDGYIKINYTGLESVPLKYSFDNGQSYIDTNIIENIAPGIYQIKVVDNENTVIPSQEKDYSGNYLSNSNIIYIFEQDSIVDERDNQVYGILKVEDQVWFAEELKFDAPGSCCYNDDIENCMEDGKLYTWNQAMNGATTENSQGICPNGWHIPSKSEWESLENNYPACANVEPGIIYTPKVKGMNFSGAGMKYAGEFMHEGYGFRYWTSTSSSNDGAFTYGSIGPPFYFEPNQTTIEDYSSVLCVKD